MELVEHRRGVHRLSSDHQDHQSDNDVNSRVNRTSISSVKDHDNDQDMLSDCDSETSEVLSVGSEPMPTADGLDVDQDEPRSGEDYESDAGTTIATRGLQTTRERDNEPGNKRSTTVVVSSPSSRSPSPSPSSSGSCNPPQSPVSNYCVTPPQHQPSPSSPAASSVRSPASSSATASSPGRPDAHQEAIVPRYQSASSNLLHQNLVHNHHQHSHQSSHLLSSGRYAAAAIVSTTRDSGDLGDYPSVVSASTITRIPGILGHHSVGLTAAGHGSSTVADLIGYSQQSIDPSRLHGRPPPAINVPLVTRLSLSPPTAMTVTGLQASTPGTAFHSVAVAAAAAAAAAAGRDPREATSLLSGHPGHLQHPGHSITTGQHPLLHQQASSQVQHVPASTTVLHHHHHQQHHHSSHRRQNSSHSSAVQHRLSVTKLLQHNSQESLSARESNSPVSPRGDDHLHHNNHHHHQDVSRNNSSPGNNSLQNSSTVSSTNNNSNHHRNNNNNNNNIQHQGNLKFSIDNILKADFGRRITDPISLKKSRPKKVVPRPIDLTKDFLESSSEGSERGSETSTTNPSPGVPNTGCNTNGPNSTNNNGSPGGTTTSSATSGATNEPTKQMLWPAWVYCTRYSDRPSSGRSPRTRRVKRPSDTRGTGTTPEEKRPRTAFSGEQLARLKREFAENRYLTERRRQQLSRDLGLNEAQIKIWFQNKRAKIKKASGQKNPLALQLMAQGLYNHSTVPLTKEEEEQAAELQAK